MPTYICKPKIYLLLLIEKDESNVKIQGAYESEELAKKEKEGMYRYVRVAWIEPVSFVTEEWIRERGN